MQFATPNLQAHENAKAAEILRGTLAQTLGLPADDPEELRLLMHTPSLFGVSKHALPGGWPQDYPPCNHPTGFWLLSARPDWSPSDNLASFCPEAEDVEDRPVCVTFGSMREVLVGGAGGIDTPPSRARTTILALTLSPGRRCRIIMRRRAPSFTDPCTKRRSAAFETQPAVRYTTTSVTARTGGCAQR